MKTYRGVILRLTEFIFCVMSCVNPRWDKHKAMIATAMKLKMRENATNRWGKVELWGWGHSWFLAIVNSCVTATREIWQKKNLITAKQLSHGILENYLSVVQSTMQAWNESEPERISPSDINFHSTWSDLATAFSPTAFRRDAKQLSTRSTTTKRSDCL